MDPVEVYGVVVGGDEAYERVLRMLGPVICGDAMGLFKRFCVGFLMMAGREFTVAVG